MNLRTEDLPNCQMQVTMSFDADEVAASFERVYTELNRRGQIPGFRPGRAPRALLIRHFGEDTIRSRAWWELVGDHLEKFLQETEVLGTLDLPSPEDVGFAAGQPCELSFVVSVPPRAEIPSLDTLVLYRPSTEPSEEEVSRILQELRESNAEEVETDRSVVGTGDAVDLEVVITKEGETEPYDRFEQTVIVGRDELFPPIGDKLLGRLVGQEITEEVTFPKDYEDKDLAGVTVTYRAKILALRERRLPELNDEFAQSVDAENFPNLEALRAEIARQTRESHERYAEQELRRQAIHSLISRSRVELPDAMVNAAAMQQAAELLEELEKEGIAPEGADAEKLAEAIVTETDRHLARKGLEISVIIKELEKRWEITPTDEEVLEYAKTWAEEHGMDFRLVRDAIALQPEFKREMESRYRTHAVVERVIAEAQVQDIPRDEYEQRRKEILGLVEAEEEASASTPVGDEMVHAQCAAETKAEMGGEQPTELPQPSETAVEEARTVAGGEGTRADSIPAQTPPPEGSV